MFAREEAGALRLYNAEHRLFDGQKAASKPVSREPTLVKPSWIAGLASSMGWAHYRGFMPYQTAAAANQFRAAAGAARASAMLEEVAGGATLLGEALVPLLL